MVNCAQNSRTCGKNGCQEIHHRLLHQRDRRVETSSSSTKDQTEPKRVDTGQREQRAEQGTLSADPATSFTEGKEQPLAQQTTIMT